jgi:hypothetical protein
MVTTTQLNKFTERTFIRNGFASKQGAITKIILIVGPIRIKSFKHLMQEYTRLMKVKQHETRLSNANRFLKNIVKKKQIVNQSRKRVVNVIETANKDIAKKLYFPKLRKYMLNSHKTKIIAKGKYVFSFNLEYNVEGTPVTLWISQSIELTERKSVLYVVDYITKQRFKGNDSTIEVTGFNSLVYRMNKNILLNGLKMKGSKIAYSIMNSCNTTLANNIDKNDGLCVINHIAFEFNQSKYFKNEFNVTKCIEQFGGLDKISNGISTNMLIEWV